MRSFIETAGLITEGVVYLVASPFIFVACKTLEVAGLLDKDEDDGS